MSSPTAHPIDVVIFGGGIAGLWTLDAAVRAGRAAALVEPLALGAGQTVCAQGIIHGGLKYSLHGGADASAAAIRDMPGLWRDCLAGRRMPDLSDVRVRAAQCHLWHTTTLRSRLGMLGARAGLRVRPVVLPPDDRPPALVACPGTVARLDEQVVDPVDLVRSLARRHRDRLLHVPLDGMHAEAAATSVRITLDSGDDTLALDATRLVLAAGAGNEYWAPRLGLPDRLAQRRPLHMLMVRGRLPWLNGHCVDGAKTRATITSDHDADGRTVWQVGGQIAEEGVSMTPEALIARGITELRGILPGVDFADVEWATYRVDRAEPAVDGRRRPEDVVADAHGPVIVAWPTKLALAPRLADQLIDLLPPARAEAGELDWPHRPAVARPPWEDDVTWYPAAPSAGPACT